MDNSSAKYDSSVELRPNTFRKDGYDFVGWADTPDGAVRFSNGASVWNLTAENGASVTLYAIWEESAETLQKPYLEQMATAFSQFHNSDYLKEDWDALTALYNQAREDILLQGKNTSAMERVVSQAKTRMEQISTSLERVEEIKTSWQSHNAFALSSAAQKPIQTALTSQILSAVQEALTSGEPENLKAFSGLSEEEPLTWAVLEAYEDIHPQLDQLALLEKAAQWLWSTDLAHETPLQNVTSQHSGSYQLYLSRFLQLDPSFTDYLPGDVEAGLRLRLELSLEKEDALRTLQAYYDSLDPDVYSVSGKAQLMQILKEFSASIESGNSSQAVLDQLLLGTEKLDQVKTAKEEEEALPPSGNSSSTESGEGENTGSQGNSSGSEQSGSSQSPSSPVTGEGAENHKAFFFTGGSALMILLLTLLRKGNRPV